jgi:YHS domain-containing protein
MVKKMLVSVFAVLFLTSFAFAEGKGMKGCPGMKGMEMGMQAKGCGMGKCPMCGPNREVKITDTKDGVTIVITSKDEKTVKEIQAQAKACSEMKCKMDGKGAAAVVNKDVKESKLDGNPDDVVICPVMGTKFKKKDAYAVYEYKGNKYYLCCKMCVAPFTTEPEKYIKK